MAGTRTYVPTLRIITALVVRYVTRYREKIDANLSPEAQTLLTALLNAALALSDALPENTPNP